MKDIMYSEFAELYEKLAGKAGKIEKAEILAEFLPKLKGHGEWGYLLYGRVVPDYDSREFGISRQLAIKAISKSFGVSEDQISNRFNKVGDLGDIAEELCGKRKQANLFKSRLTVSKVFDNLKKIMEIEGKGAVERKMNLASEILGSASPLEAKYIIRTLLNDLRVGVAEGILRDALAKAFFPENQKEMAGKIEDAYHLANDFAVVFEAVSKGEKELEKIDVTPGKPMNVMLAVKVESVEEAFEMCGKPAAIEQKYDGFRMLINKRGNEITLFTRRLENVTKQFPDVVEAVKLYVKGDDFIIDSEIVGYDSETKKYLPFQAISQRIKRKYDIENLIKELPVEINVFDILYYNGESIMKEPFKDRRKLLEKVVKAEKYKMRPAIQIITSDEKEAMDFYKEALKMGEEGIIVKNINSDYKSGRRVGYMCKLKPTTRELDLVIVGAEHGTGKRAGWLTSYILGCRSGNDFLEVGKVSSGLKEKEEEGTTYKEITKMLKPLIIREEKNVVYVKPKIVVSVVYQNVQVSPSYNSGYALRFPRITMYRPDRNTGDIASLEDIKKEARKG